MQVTMKDITKKYGVSETRINEVIAESFERRVWDKINSTFGSDAANAISNICVVAKYTSGCTEYNGPVAFVLFAGGPELSQVYLDIDGEVTRCCLEKEYN